MAEDKNMTISDIANELGVSKTTVSRAISGKGRIGADTRQKILSYIEEHNYHPNVIAKGLAKSKTYNIGLVIPGDYNIVELPFFQKCMLGISKIASSMDYDVLLTIVTDDDISQLKRVVINHKADGIILTRTHVNDVSASYLKEMGIPFVTIGSMEDDSIVQIDNDHRNACKELTKKLLEQGTDKIALIGGSQDYVVTKSRLEGFISACLQMGKIPDKEYIYLDVKDEKNVRSIVSELLDDSIDCIITMDDYLCSCVLDTLRQKKVAISNGIKVASFYNSSILDNYISDIPSIIFDVEELGKMTCCTLLRMIKGETVPKRTLLGYRLSHKYA
ncbi:MAG: LacI family DNA-binding transcriptional regulator [Lachnospiraceae bacterium]|nr:LacI family DNA-binding transcriptional regulator [Lachnospiraceae bacterium]